MRTIFVYAEEGAEEEGAEEEEGDVDTSGDELVRAPTLHLKKRGISSCSLPVTWQNTCVTIRSMAMPPGH